MYRILRSICASCDFFSTKEKIEVDFKEIKDKKFNESMFIQRNLRHQRDCVSAFMQFIIPFY